jgi:hypothetical protein
LGDKKPPQKKNQGPSIALGRLLYLYDRFDCKHPPMFNATLEREVLSSYNYSLLTITIFYRSEYINKLLKYSEGIL